MRFGELIGLGREIKGWTQKELAQQSGVSASDICRIEALKSNNPSFRTTVMLCDALGISLDRAAEGQRAHLDALRSSAALQSKGGKDG